MKKLIQMMLLIALGLAIPYAYGAQPSPAKNTKKEQKINFKKTDTKSSKTSATNTKSKTTNKDKTKSKKKDKSETASNKMQLKSNKNSLPKNSKTNLKNENTNSRSKTLANRNNLDSYPNKIIGMYASGTNKTACVPILATYKKTKQWPSLQISSQQIINRTEKLNCKPEKIKAMDGNFYVAENCRNEKNRSISRHLIYIKNNDSLRINSDNKTQSYIQCNVNTAGK